MVRLAGRPAIDLDQIAPARVAAFSCAFVMGAHAWRG
jgi:hypothetical protein